MENNLSKTVRKIIPFVKYTLCGNNFIIIDEINKPILSEPEKSIFAYYATNSCFGIGCDNLLILQRCTPDSLAAINGYHHYWNKLPQLNAQYIFRMFEPNGEEAYCCGNGLLSIADYLYRQYGVEKSTIVTEIPLSKPELMKLGTNTGAGISWVNMGYPRRLLEGSVDAKIPIIQINDIDYLPEIKIAFRNYDLMPFTDSTSINLSGYAIFTGEPHLVIIVDQGIPLPELREALFTSPFQSADKKTIAEKRANFGSWLLHHIGLYINKQYKDLFPMGINVNVVINNGDTLEYRCFERGINRETLACGTGALAVTYVMQAVDILKTTEVCVLPFRCRWYEKDAELKVSETQDGWLLGGHPDYLLQGAFDYCEGAVNKNQELLNQKKLLPYEQSPNTESVIEQHKEDRDQINNEKIVNSPTILIVEDNPLDVKLLRACLDNKDYELLFAETGKQALQILNNQNIDLVLLDVMLPDINGYKICQVLKGNKFTRHVPVIFTTSLNDLTSRINGIKVESDAYLIKPYNFKELVTLIEVLLKKKRYFEAMTANYEPYMESAVGEGGFLLHKDESVSLDFFN
jgi:diaminopimelate epimerase